MYLCMLGLTCEVGMRLGCMLILSSFTLLVTMETEVSLPYLQGLPGNHSSNYCLTNSHLLRDEDAKVAVLPVYLGAKRHEP